MFEFEQARLHAPQSAVVVSMFVSHPCDGSAVQCPKPVSQLSEQSLLQVPSMGLQHVVALQTTDPVLTV